LRQDQLVCFLARLIFLLLFFSASWSFDTSNFLLTSSAVAKTDNLAPLVLVGLITVLHLPDHPPGGGGGMGSCAVPVEDWFAISVMARKIKAHNPHNQNAT
jgi:hypothetical protein